MWPAISFWNILKLERAGSQGEQNGGLLDMILSSVGSKTNLTDQNPGVGRMIMIMP